MDPAHPGEQGSGRLCNQIARKTARIARGGGDVSFALALFVREAMTCLKVGSDGRMATHQHCVDENVWRKLTLFTQPD